jgi:hypothetical protein
MLPTVTSSLINEGCSALRAGVGSLEAGLLLAMRPLRRGGGSTTGWREVALFFLLGGGELVNAAMMNENATGEERASTTRTVTAAPVPCRAEFC